jgi:hypothetical protein
MGHYIVQAKRTWQRPLVERFFTLDEAGIFAASLRQQGYAVSVYSR